MNVSEVIVVDYGIGNVLSVCRAVEQCGGTARLSADAKAIAGAERLILPGVGAFGDCMAALASLQFIAPIKKFIGTGRPFLGICVGMQMLLDFGEEFSGAEGLGLIKGRVRQIPIEGDGRTTRKIPHIGWSGIAPPQGEDARAWQRTIFSATRPRTPFYFVHSFNAMPENAEDILAIADYEGVAVTAAVCRGNITGTQFHLEKSGEQGLRLLSTFIHASG